VAANNPGKVRGQAQDADKMTMSIFYFLGFCTGFIPGDQEMTYALCEMEMEAKAREIEVKEPWDEFERVYFEYEINRRI